MYKLLARVHTLTELYYNQQNNCHLATLQAIIYTTTTSTPSAWGKQLACRPTVLEQCQYYTEITVLTTDLLHTTSMVLTYFVEFFELEDDRLIGDNMKTELK